MTDHSIIDRDMLGHPSAPRPMLRAAALIFAGAAFIVLQSGTRVPAGALHQHDGAQMMSASRPSGITATTISEEKLSHVAGKTITVEIVEFAPLAFAPEHHHAGSVSVYVLSGTIRSQLAGGPVLDYKAGESFFEPPGAVHVLARNPSATEPAKFMAIHIADDGAQLTTYH
jgi:quercetin dioxygenase-like cupin family protein